MYKRIGIIGGLSAESTATYYLDITRSYVRKYGTCGYPEIIIISVDLEQYHRWRSADRWDLIAGDLTRAAEILREAGASFGLIATNTMHKVFDDVQRTTALPLLHILDPVIQEMNRAGLNKVGVLGTRFTMQGAFYRDRLVAGGLCPLVPDETDQETIHRILVEELVKGQRLESSREAFRQVMDRLAQRGAEGIILGCTEISLLVKPEDSRLPLFDTAVLHAQAALERALDTMPSC